MVFRPLAATGPLTLGGGRERLIEGFKGLGFGAIAALLTLRRMFRSTGR